VLRTTLGAACAVLVLATSVPLAPAAPPAATRRCAADPAACPTRLPASVAVVRGEVAGLGGRASSVVLATVRVTSARPKVRAAIRRAGRVEVVVPAGAVILVRDDAGEEAEVFSGELLDAVDAGVAMEARATGRAFGTSRRPAVRATRLVVRVADLADVLPAEDDAPVEDDLEDPFGDDAPVDEGTDADGFPAEDAA
jgi:hypothetical protein